MDDKRQKNQLELAFIEEDRGEAPKGLPEGTESFAGKRSPANAEQLMESLRAGKLQAGIETSQGQ